MTEPPSPVAPSRRAARTAEAPLTLPHHGAWPEVHPSAFVAANATLIGELAVGAEASVWFGAVVRADVMPIRIGARSNVQDLSMLHATGGWAPTLIGAEVTVGHAVLLHGCSIADRVLVGMGSIVMDGAEIGSDSILGAGSLVTARTRIPSGVLALGRPAKVVRQLSDDERQSIRDSAARYVAHAADYRDETDPR
ncbi:MAG: gamma carbonic anhydrase family protein [Polyangiales bacterium]